MRDNPNQLLFDGLRMEDTRIKGRPRMGVSSYRLGRDDNQLLFAAARKMDMPVSRFVRRAARASAWRVLRPDFKGGQI